MKRLSTVFALAAVAAASAALAQQQTTPQRQAQPPAGTTQSQSSDPKADKQALMKNCLSQTKAAHPGAVDQDIKEYCTKVVNAHSTPHD